jgi:hypothetical protein
MARPKPSAPQWQPGQSGNPKGRPIGSRNKLNEKFILALHDDFAKHGPAVIAEVREKRPETYYEGDRINPSERASFQKRERVRRYQR